MDEDRTTPDKQQPGSMYRNLLRVWHGAVIVFAAIFLSFFSTFDLRWLALCFCA